VADQLDNSWRRTLKRRLAVAAVILAVWSVAIEARLVYLQVVQHDALLAAAVDQQLETIPLEPKRGDILDRNGRLLAYNVDTESVWVVPGDIKNAKQLVDDLCGALRKCTRQERETYISRLTRRDAKGKLKKFVRLARWISTEEAARITDLKLPVTLRRETHRYYPHRELAAHAIGYVGDENTGRAGIEEQYDWLIGGQKGRAFLQIDGNRRPFSRLEEPPTPGASLILTIDEYIQHVVERELAEGVRASGAERGSAIVMDPFTGEILAIANVPTFNPNNFKSYKEEIRKNPAAQDVYEPGSTFKVVTAGAALEEKLARPSDLINTSPGVIRFGGRVIDEAKGHNYGTLTFEDVIVKSSNVGAIRIGLRLGAERLTSYVSRFGFGARTSSDRFPGESGGDFPGESKGIVWKASELTDSAVASVSMGYQVSVTALQMAAAFSAVANGGELVEPRLVRAVIRNGVQQMVPRKVVRRVLSPTIAAELTTIMEGVVERGTAKTAQVEGFTIAGKTGTAAKAYPGRGYSTTDYNVSFVGFVPSREPQFTILVVIDSPHKVSPYGGTVAGPVFQKIAAAILRHRGVSPTLNRPTPVLVARRDENQPRPVSGPAEPTIVTLAADASDSPAVFPDLVGMNARDAARALVRLGISPRLYGNGTVVSQRPAAGSPIDVVDSATLWLERRPHQQNPVAEAQPVATGTGGISRGRP
jgi:cell division protein FtsI (penicillin-binding protein 3)